MYLGDLSLQGRSHACLQKLRRRELHRLCDFLFLCWWTCTNRKHDEVLPGKIQLREETTNDND